MNHQCGMNSEKKINIFTKEACYPNSKNLVCVKKKFFTEQINKVTVASFKQNRFTAKIYYYSIKLNAHELSESHLCMTSVWLSCVNFSVADGSKSHIFAYKFSLHLLILWKLWRPSVDLIYIFHSLDIPTCLILPINYWETLQQT